jgi:aminoglycoside phosphotransferase family enzyme
MGLSRRRRVYKLKKPARFAYLDFSTLARREAACRAEDRLNRRLAPDVYLGIVPLTGTSGGLSLGGPGAVVDWLVMMRRLDERHTLEAAIAEERLDPADLDRILGTLVAFYRRSRPTLTPPAAHLWQWHQSMALKRRILLYTRLDVPRGLVRRVDGVQRRSCARTPRDLEQRARRHRIVDGHGDLRPEHIWLDHRVRIIDRLEFNPALRAVDPSDEIAYLSLECERLGTPWAGRRLQQRFRRAWPHAAGLDLFVFYRCYRATLRARLAIAHLLEPNPRTPEKWPRLARLYLEIAAADARRLDRLQKTSRSLRSSP